MFFTQFFAISTGRRNSRFLLEFDLLINRWIIYYTHIVEYYPKWGGGDYGTCYITDKIGGIKLYEISESHREITAWLHLQEVSWIGKFRDRKSTTGCQGWGTQNRVSGFRGGWVVKPAQGRRGSVAQHKPTPCPWVPCWEWLRRQIHVLCVLLQVQMGNQSVLVLPASSYSWSLTPVFHVWMEPLPGAHTAQQPRCSTRAPWKGHAPQCVFVSVFYMNLIRRALLPGSPAPTGICFLEMESCSTIAWGEHFVFAPWNVVSHSVTSKQW